MTDKIPMGFGNQAANKARQLGLPMPPFSSKYQDYPNIIRSMEEFIQKVWGMWCFVSVELLLESMNL